MNGDVTQHYIAGRWVGSAGGRTTPIVDPATEEVVGHVVLGSRQDANAAVAAGRGAFDAWSRASVADRLDLLRSVLDGLARRRDELADAVTSEMGAPVALAQQKQAVLPVAHFRKMIEVLEGFRFTELRGTTLIAREPAGVCALITPWNWPLNQIACKVAPALAAGCTMVLKPSELAPYSAALFAQIAHEAGVPAGVFNMVHGDGAVVGSVLSSHPDVDLVSFTGSTRAGIQVAKTAADTVKRVHQELGGKSANIILSDADFAVAVERGTAACMSNTGQSCNAPTRMLVPRVRHDEAVEVAAGVAARLRVGTPRSPETDIGPLANAPQFAKVQAMIEAGIREGARLAAGGEGRPEGFNRGLYVRPTVFAAVDPSMRVAREEIFGPVLSIIPYDDEEDALAIANATEFGLAAYVQSGDLDRARRLAGRLRAGTVSLNYPAWDPGAPFGGYRQSGNGREYGEFGLVEFLEVKGVVGYGAAQ